MIRAATIPGFPPLLPALAAALALAGFPSATAAPTPTTAPGDMIFPSDAGLVDVSLPPYNAPRDGQGDATAAIQKALDDFPNLGAIIYLPHGTYLISNTLKWPHGTVGGQEEKNTILQGQGVGKTILKLKDACAGFTDPAHPKAMVWTGADPAQRFSNAMWTLTLDAGSGNPGAIGAQFMANNQGGMRDVEIRSGDGAGKIGLDLGYVNENGPLLLKRVKITGFDEGLVCGAAQNSVTFEDLTLEGQKVLGLRNDGQCLSGRNFSFTGAVTAIRNGGGTGVLTLVGAALKGTGAASGQPAILNQAACYLRDVDAAGFARAVDNQAGTKQGAAGPAVAEFSSHGPASLFPSPAHALRLPVKEAPELPLDPFDQWQKVAAPANGADAGPAIQAAIDAGKPTVYLPRGSYIVKTQVLVRGNVRRIVGATAYVEIQAAQGQSGFKVVDGGAPVVAFERMTGGYYNNFSVENASSRTVVMRHLCNWNGRFTGSGDVFIEDVCSAPWSHWEFGKQDAWARQFNVENEGTHVSVDGGKLWILGYKTERGGTLIENKGGQVELLGGFGYTTTDPGTSPMFANLGGAFSATFGEACYTGKPFTILVHEERDGAAKDLKPGDVPGRAGGSLLPLYTGYAAGSVRARGAAPRARRAAGAWIGGPAPRFSPAGAEGYGMDGRTWPGPGKP